MRSKRVLTMLLAVIMALSVLSPAAMAVGSNRNAQFAPSKVVDTTSKNPASALEIDQQAPVANQAQGMPTLRDESGKLNVSLQDAETADGKWIATAVDKDLDLAALNRSETFQELQEAKEVFAQDETVAAFVVMEESPLSELFSSIASVTKADEEKLLAIQDKVIAMIEKLVLGGQELDVRYQFTYLTNAFTITTEFANLFEIAQMENVKSVFIMPVYNVASPVEEGIAPHTESSGQMTGVHQVWQDLGYTGQGMKIAIIDTGLDLDHPSFAADPELGESSMTVEDIDAVLEDLNAYDLRSSIVGDTLYRSAKVPFAFNYVDASLTADHSADSQGDHGTHVAGIAAANAVEGSGVVGMAPDAQLVVMKVFGANGGAYMDDITAALEDAMTLGCDVVNASLGSAAGFDSSNSELDLIFQRIQAQDTVVNFSAGNDGTSSYGNIWGTDLNRTASPDNATVGSPSTYANVMSIAAAENAVVKGKFFTLADGTEVYYTDPGSYLVGLDALADQELEYVIVSGLGNPEDYCDADGNSLVEGKVAIVKRGELNFSAKVFNAQAAGAIACLVWNNATGDIIMQISDDDGNLPDIPSASISLADGEIMEAAETKTITVCAELGNKVNAAGGQIASFSSWGVAPDLRLLPDITGIGGDVYSCYDGGGYGLMSGTSMSAPQVSGVAALVMQYLQEKYPASTNDGTLRALAEALMMSTAKPVVSQDSGVEASPRQQGSGLVDAMAAVTTGAYLTVDGGRPKAELGDSDDGVYSFSFEVNNFSDEELTYTLDASLLTEDALGMRLSDTEVEYFMAGYDMALSGTVEFDQDTVTVAPGESAVVNVSIALSEDDKELFEVVWENGGYVEGYVYLNTADAEGTISQLSLPFLGFYGSWADVPVFDTAFWYDNSFWGVDPVDGVPEGDQYYTILWTSLGGSDYVLGFNPYGDPYVDENGNVAYDPSYNVLSPNGDGILDSLSEIYLSLMRNARDLTISYSIDGQVVDSISFQDARKTMYMSSYGQIVPWLYSWEGVPMYNFTDADGGKLSTGTVVTMTVQAQADYEDGGDHTLEFPILIDNEKPALLGLTEVEQDGRYYLVVEAADNHKLGAIVLSNPAGTNYYGWVTDADLVDTENGQAAAFDITDLGTEFTVILGDYAANEVYFDVEYTSAGDNLPIMDDTRIYGYRMSDDHLMSDHMYGWISMAQPGADGEEAYVAVHTDDYREYAAVNAAEQVGGKIFAVDAVGEFFVADAGLWNRKTIRSLGLNVLDMTFDDSTDTMYLLVKESSNSYLYTLDILTGETVQIAEFGYYNYGPYAIADDDNGTIYAIQYGQGNLYTLDDANGYALTPVMQDDAEVVFTDANGNSLNPNYAQSMVYEDGKLYWAYFSSSYRGDASELMVIDLATMTAEHHSYVAEAYDSDGNLVEYYPMTELVALHSLKATDYQIPAAEALSDLLLSTDSLVLTLGDAYAVELAPLPWNFQITEATWTSSDEAVATVADGVITAVAEGTATITVTAHGLTKTVEVSVVDTRTTFTAYNYYDAAGNYGYMVEVDTEKMGYELLTQSPVDFFAADYNGHDGWYYGYTEGGQFWRYSLETEEYAKLGEPLGTTPVDMAYDYSTGLMYALTLDYNTGVSGIYMVNLQNGKLVSVDAGEYASSIQAMVTLACDADGNLYTLDSLGTLYRWEMDNGVIVNAEILVENLGELQYMQSMCWDYENDVILWAYCELGSIVWLDPTAGQAIALGDPTNSGMFEFVGMFTVPAEIPELPYVAVSSVEAEDMLILAGTSRIPNVTVLPLNATNTTVTWTSADETVATVQEDGTITGINPGVVTINGVLTDGESTFEASFEVTVLEAADNLYGHVLTDLETYGGQYWARLYAKDPSDPDVLNSTSYTLYAEEYVDGKLYALGYDSNDWEANWQYMVIDPDTYVIEEMIEMPENYPFVYDITFDYATATMYAVAGAGSEASDLYVMNMENGELTLLMATTQFFMNLAAGGNGVLYAMDSTQQVIVGYDDYGWEIYDYTDATLYAIDPIAETLEKIGETGMKSNMLSSMTYDYDTGNLYWTPFFDNGYVNSLAVVDVETGKAASLGTVGAAGGQVIGLYVICDEFPEKQDDVLHKVLLSAENAVLTVGSTGAMKATMIPGTVDAELTFASSDPAIATVDDQGIVTAVAQGKAAITVTAVYEGITKTATANVAVLSADAAFLSWNQTDMGWSAVSRSDLTNVATITRDEAVGVTATAVVGNTVYGYDENNQFFQLNADYTRTAIGTPVEVDTDNGYAFEVRDLAYDAANDRLLVLGATLLWNPDWDEYDELVGGCAVYAVDLTTGALTELFVFQDHYYIRGLACDEAGMVYFYTAYDDGLNRLDLATGTVTPVVSLQTMGLYGDGYSAQSMYYDALTGQLYLQFTTNGTTYRMITCDIRTGLLTELSKVGTPKYYTDLYDSFTSLCFADFMDVTVRQRPFVDMSDSYWAYDSIYYCYEEGYLKGVTETTFEPLRQITRAEFAILLYRVLGLQDYQASDVYFSDVPETAWFYNEVSVLAEMGIVNGVDDGVFAPFQPIRRQELVTMLYRVIGYDVELELSFSDVRSIDDYARNAVKWAVSEGLVEGYDDGTFLPKGYTTRAEAAAIIQRLTTPQG